MNKQYWKGVLHYVGHKIINGILWSLLSSPKMKIMRWKMQKVSHNKFQQNQWNGLWDTHESPFMVLYALDFIVDKYGWKWEQPD